MKQTKPPYIPLTINPEATKINVLAKEKELKKYARRRRIHESTLVRILSSGKSAYPFQAHEKSKYQRALRFMKADGYLVEIVNQPLDEAA